MVTQNGFLSQAPHHSLVRSMPSIFNAYASTHYLFSLLRALFSPPGRPRPRPRSPTQSPTRGLSPTNKGVSVPQRRWLQSDRWQNSSVGLRPDRPEDGGEGGPKVRKRVGTGREGEELVGARRGGCCLCNFLLACLCAAGVLVALLARSFWLNSDSIDLFLPDKHPLYRESRTPSSLRLPIQVAQNAG